MLLKVSREIMEHVLIDMVSSGYVNTLKLIPARNPNKSVMQFCICSVSNGGIGNGLLKGPVILQLDGKADVKSKHFMVYYKYCNSVGELPIRDKDLYCIANILGEVDAAAISVL